MASPVPPSGTVTAFAVDTMLGRLARWLRILGHDVAYGPHLRRRTLQRCARREGRLLLTRDTRLVRDPEMPPYCLIRSDGFRDQLREVAAVVPLGGALLRRCLDCNRPLVPVAASARTRVPDFVASTQPELLHCTGCDRLYWPATHAQHMRTELSGLGLA
ncbi:MAG TPA: Mut7-C RNAse domain-containing protein [Candidatus Binatia bacterium]|jgi:uncharacterized protein with PIN domain|nr:Mut7-C RNAse domain-containing protein [Candidatus Binatia bacterium]